MPITQPPNQPGDQGQQGPSSEALDKNALAAAKATIEALKLKKVQLELNDAFEKSKKAVSGNAEKIQELTKDQEDLAKAYEVVTADIMKQVEQLKNADKFHNKLITAYSQTSQKLVGYAQSVNALLKTYHSYNLEVQKLIDLSGRSSQGNEKNRQDFEKMRKELTLTRKEAEEFGKTWSQASRMGIDVNQITAVTKQLQGVFGQKEGTAAAGRILQSKVGTGTMTALMSAQPSAARGTAMAEAMRTGTLEEARDISGLRGKARGPEAERAVRFEKAGATAAKFKDDIQAGMAAALDLGMGPEMGALALPLAEINANVAKLVENTVGMKGWLKEALTTGPEGKGGMSIGGLTEGAGSLKDIGKSVMAGFKGGGGAGGAKGAFGALKGGLGGLSKALPGLGGVALKGGVGFGGALLGKAIESGSDALLPEGHWRKAGHIAGKGIEGAATGFMYGGHVGAAVGGAIGTGYGVYEQYGEQINKMVTGWVASGDKWVKAQLGFADAVEEVDIGQLMTDYKAMASELPKKMENTISQIAALPSILEDQIAQSRLPVALASIDPGPMTDMMNKSMAAYSDSMNKLDAEVDSQMKTYDEQAKGFKKVIEQKGVGSEEGAAAAGSLKTIEANRKQTIMQAEQERERRSLASRAQQQIQGFETRRGQIGQETQAVTMAYERKHAGTGNVEEMQKVIDQIAKGSDEALDRYQIAADNSKKLYNKQMEDAEIKLKSGLLDEDRTKQEQYKYDQAKVGLENLNRQIPIVTEQIAAEKQTGVLQKTLEQAMAATETIMFKKSQRAMALSKAQESYAREAGKGPEEIGAYAGAQAAEAGTQLDAFMDKFQERMAGLEASKVGAKNDVERMSIEMRIKDLADERVKLEAQSLEARMHAATAEEKYNQELIGANKRISEIQRDSAAKLGMSWQVQMKYQSETIRASREEIDSIGKELAGMAEEIKRSGGDPEKEAKFKQRSADQAQKQADLISTVLGKQRSFLESSIANSFGIGGGTKVNPVINSRLFGEQVQNVAGQRQALRPGERGATREQIQAKNIRAMMFGGIGEAVPAPGEAPGLAPGEAIPKGAGKPGAQPGAPGQAAAGAGQDISGRIEIALKDDVLETRVVRIVRTNFMLPGGKGG